MNSILLFVCLFVIPQFYHLASVRLQDLCNRLELYDEDLRKKIWTCFEYSVMYHTDLMQDRHLDQILMCAVYVICKVIVSFLFFSILFIGLISNYCHIGPFF